MKNTREDVTHLAASTETRKTSLSLSLFLCFAFFLKCFSTQFGSTRHFQTKTQTNFAY
jgi:hypothetical protein